MSRQPQFYRIVRVAGLFSFYVISIADLGYIGINVSPFDPLYNKLRLAFARTAARTAAKQLQRAEGIEVPTPDAQPIHSLTAPIEKTPVTPGTASVKTSTAPSFEEVIKSFLDTYAKSKKTAMYRKHQPVLTMLLEIVGNKQVTELRQADINGFFNLLGRLPPRWRDECRKQKLTVRQLAELEHPIALGPKSFDDTYLASVRDTSEDLVNSYIDHGNYIAYGYAATALNALGISFALPVMHGKTRRGALVFDVADIFKDTVVLPHAFISVEQGLRDQEFRDSLIEICMNAEVMDRAIQTIQKVVG